MVEHEPGESDDIFERLIPEIPGVIPSNEESEDWGALTDEPEEDTEEDITEETSKEIKFLLGLFGVEGLSGVPQESIINLWERMGMSNYLIADLALYSTIDVQRLYRDELKRPKFKDLQERSEISENPYDVRIKLIEEVTPNLETLGYGSLTAYRATRASNEDLAQAFKIEGWLAGLSFMRDLPVQLITAKAAARGRKLKRSKVFRITKDEIVRQARIAESDEIKEQFDFRLHSHQEAYDHILKSLKTAYKVADMAFSRFISD